MNGSLHRHDPDLQSVVHGILAHDELRRELILKLLISHGEEVAQIGGAFADRVAGYMDGTLRPWARTVEVATISTGIHATKRAPGVNTSRGE